MSIQDLKLPKKGAVARITAEQRKLRKQPASERLREIFRKENYKQPLEKKIASSPERDPEVEI